MFCFFQFSKYCWHFQGRKDYRRKTILIHSPWKSTRNIIILRKSNNRVQWFFQKRFIIHSLVVSRATERLAVTSNETIEERGEGCRISGLFFGRIAAAAAAPCGQHVGNNCASCGKIGSHELRVLHCAIKAHQQQPLCCCTRCELRWATRFSGLFHGVWCTTTIEKIIRACLHNHQEEIVSDLPKSPKSNWTRLAAFF